MKQMVVNIRYDEEKMAAIRQYMGKKDADFDEELKDVMNKMYEKYVPPAVREYIESRGEVPPLIKKAAVQPVKKSGSVNANPDNGAGSF
jgi:hypothetical protein